MNIVNAIEDLMAQPSRCGATHIIAIDGRAGAGKTTLAQELFLAFSLDRKVTVIHLDEIYAGWDLALTDTLKNSLVQILESVRSGGSTKFPIYDWAQGRFNETREITPCDLIIIEGVGSAQSLVREYATVTIWLDIDPQTGLRRVLARDGSRIHDQMNRWQIREEEHFRTEATRENADFILSTL